MCQVLFLKIMHESSRRVTDARQKEQPSNRQQTSCQPHITILLWWYCCMVWYGMVWSYHNNKQPTSNQQATITMAWPPSHSYGAVPNREDAPITATVVTGTPSLVKLVSPSDLPGGYECPVEVLGSRMVATVVSGMCAS